MARISNPYFAGPPATQPNTFFGRQDILRFVDETLASPKHNVIVFQGQRRIGKTSILHQILHRSGQDYQAVFFDLQSSMGGPADDLLYTLAREIAGTLQLPPPDRVAFQSYHDAFRTIFLPQVYEHLNDKRLLLLIDEFDALSLATAPNELERHPFMQSLNRIIQSDDKRAIFLFVVGRHFKDLSSQQQLYILRVGLNRQIGLLKKEDTLRLITQSAQNFLTYQEPAIERIWALANGHPYCTQLLCYEIFNHAQRQNIWTVTEADVERVIDDAISTGQSALQWIWEDVPPVERFTLYTIGQLTGEEDGATLDQLIALRDAQRVQVADHELRALPDKLVDRQVLERASGERYRFAVELIRRWIVHNHSWEEVTTELSRAAVNELAKALFETGRAAYRTGDMSFAIENFSRALSIDSNYVEARLWLARARLKNNDLLAAIDEFDYVQRFGGREAREARLDLADARVQYGQQLENENQFEQAQQEYQRTLDLIPKHPMASARLSEIFRGQADELLESEGVAAAEPFYKQVLIYNPSPDLGRKIKERLDQYSQAQAEANKWEEAEQATRLSAELKLTTGDNQQSLLQVQLDWARWLLSQHEVETAATVYHRLLAETVGEIPRQTIENDLLRYSRQQEETTGWDQVEVALTLLAQLFPDHVEYRDLQIDHLCRQAEFYLSQDDLTRAGAAYQRALTYTPSNPTLHHSIKASFQSYRRTRTEDKTIQTRTTVATAMRLLVEILGQADPVVYQWRSEAQTELGDALRQESQPAEAQIAYRQAEVDMTYFLQASARSDQAYPQRMDIWLRLGQLDLDEARFDLALGRFRQVLADTAANEQIVQRIKTLLNDYRHQQEKLFQWHHARQALEMLAQLFPEDEQVRLWQAETNATLADWHLQRAMPDLDEAQRLARSALDVDLPDQEAEAIFVQVKNSFQDRSLQQEQAQPPNWTLAEQILNRLVSLLPDDPSVHHWLAETRTRQGDWYLTQPNHAPDEDYNDLTSAAEVYRRALNDLPNDIHLVMHLKKSFRVYQQRYQFTSPLLARQALETLARLLPGDEEVRQWLVENKNKNDSKPRQGWQRRWVVIAAIMVVTLCLGGGILTGSITPFLSTPTPPSPMPPLPTATVTSLINTPTSTPALPPDTPIPPTNTPTPTSTNTPIPPTNTPTPTPTDTSTSTPTDTPTPTPTNTPTPPPIQLVGPTDGANFQGASPPPRLEWQPMEGLPADERLAVEVSYRGKDSSNEFTLYTREWVNDSSWEIPVDIFYQSDPNRREIQWRVVLVKIDPTSSNIIDELDTASETRTFTWERKPLPEGAGLAVAVNPDDPLQVFVILKEIGIYISDNSGIDWRLVSNQSNLETLHIAPANPKIIYTGTSGQILKSEDGGETWQPRPIPPKEQVYAIVTDPDNVNIVFAATEKGIVRSDDGGGNWVTLLDAVDGTLDRPFYSLVIVKRSQGNWIYAAGKGDQIYWQGTIDANSNWQRLVCTGSCTEPIFALAVDPSNSNKLLLGSDAGRLAISSNLGGDWNQATTPRASIPQLKFSVIAFTPAGPDIVYAGSGTHRHPSDGEGLYRSLDGGDTWGRFNAWASNEGSGTYIQGITLDPTNSQIIFIAGSEGVFRSDDGGVSWAKQ